MKYFLTIVLILFKFNCFAQLFFTEPISFNYNKGHSHNYYTLTDNLCYWENCLSQMRYIGPSVDLDAFNTKQPDVLAWKPFSFYEKYENGLLGDDDWISADFIRGYFDLDSGQSRIYHKIKIWPDGVSRYRFHSNSNYGNFRGFKTINFYDSAYLNISLMSIWAASDSSLCIPNLNSPYYTIIGTLKDSANYLIIDGILPSPLHDNHKYSDNSAIFFSYNCDYYLLNKASIGFNLPVGYWAWFLKSETEGCEILGLNDCTTKIAVWNPGKSYLDIKSEIKNYNYTNQKIIVK